LEDVVAQLSHISQRLDQHEQLNKEIVDHINGQAQGEGQNELSLADLYEMTDEQLQAIGLTREEVNAAVDEALAEAEAAGELQPGEGQEGDLEPAGAAAGQEGAPAGAAQGAGVDASPAGATAMKSLEKRLVHLENRTRVKELRAKQDAETKELSEIEGKVVTLAQQRDDAVLLAETYKAENDALRLAVRTGTRPVRAGVDNGMRMFSATENGQLHEFQVRVKQIMEADKKSEAEALRFAQKENPALHADWLASQRTRRVATS
jgi:hypothetical protein